MLWGGLEVEILFLPASYHDILFMLILGLSIDPRERRIKYYHMVCWFMAGLFLVQSALQVFDIRPPGENGAYDLYTDNIANGLYILAFIVAISVMIKLKMLKWRSNTVFLYSAVTLFLAVNFLLTMSAVRELVVNYSLVYDITYYLVLYAIVLSVNGPINVFIRNCYNSVSGLLHTSGLHIRGIK
jgi:hypothetical protein